MQCEFKIQELALFNYRRFENKKFMLNPRIREPELLEIGDSFRVNLYRPSYSEVHQSAPKSTPKSIPKSAPKSAPKSIPPNTPNDMNQTQQKIIEMILNDSKVTQVAMAKKLGVTTSAVKKSIKELSDRKILKHTGSSRSGYWEVLERGEVLNNK